RVPFVAGVVLVDEDEAVALAHGRDAGARLTEQAEVAGAIGVVLDPDFGGERAVREFAHVDGRGGGAAVDVVFGQVPVRQHAAPVDRGGERVDPGAVARCDEEQGDAHVLVPGDVVGVVGGGDPERVSLVDADAPVGAGGGQREVPGDRARGFVIARLRAEDPGGVRGRAGRGGDAGRGAACVGDVACLAAAGPSGRVPG